VRLFFNYGEEGVGIVMKGRFGPSEGVIKYSIHLKHIENHLLDGGFFLSHLLRPVLCLDFCRAVFLPFSCWFLLLIMLCKEDPSLKELLLVRGTRHQVGHVVEGGRDV